MASASTPTTTARAAAGKSGRASSPPTWAGRTPAPARPWSCGATEKRGQYDGNSSHLSRHAARHQRSRCREPGVLQALRPARLPFAEMRRLRPAALPADHGLSVVRLPEVGLGGL